MGNRAAPSIGARLDTRAVRPYIRGMSTMITEVYEAFKEAGASETKSQKAAEAIADYENRFVKIESDLGLLKWMVGFNLAASPGIVLIVLQ